MSLAFSVWCRSPSGFSWCLPPPGGLLCEHVAPLCLSAAVSLLFWHRTWTFGSRRTSFRGRVSGRQRLAGVLRRLAPHGHGFGAHSARQDSRYIFMGLATSTPGNILHIFFVQVVSDPEVDSRPPPRAVIILAVSSASTQVCRFSHVVG